MPSEIRLQEETVRGLASPEGLVEPWHFCKNRFARAIVHFPGRLPLVPKRNPAAEQGRQLALSHLHYTQVPKGLVPVVPSRMARLSSPRGR